MTLPLNQILEGDCLELMKQLPDKCIDLVVTDPPYGIGINKMSFVTSGAVKAGVAIRHDFSNHKTEWDNQPLSEAHLSEIFRISRNQVIFGANYFANNLLPSGCWIVWDKRVMDKYSNDFADCELAWTSFDKPSRVIRYLWSGMLQQDMKNKEERVHPTQKPVKVMSEILERFSKEGDIILDPFTGSGSTLVAAEKLNRKWIGMEINPEYCKIARGRIANVQNQDRLTAFL